jgi:hypothetical protein
MPEKLKGVQLMSNKRNLLLDITIFAAFLAVANPSLHMVEKAASRPLPQERMKCLGFAKK